MIITSYNTLKFLNSWHLIIQNVFLYCLTLLYDYFTNIVFHQEHRIKNVTEMKNNRKIQLIDKQARQFKATAHVCTSART